MNAGAITAIVSAAAAVIGMVVAYLTYRYMLSSKDTWAKTDDTFLRARRMLKSEMPILQSIAQESQRRMMLEDGVPLLVKPGWIPAVPLPLESVRLDWVEPAGGELAMRAVFEPAREITRRYWTRASEYRDTYHDVIDRLERPDRRLFFDGSSFRLLDVATAPGPADALPALPAGGPPAGKAPVTLTFTAGRYFDALDTTDVLGYETALRTIRLGQRDIRRAMRGRYRRWLGDPFDLRRRCGIPGVCALTIRRGDPAPSFILHERNPQKVALAQGVAHVTPAGEFQPRDLSSLASIVDLDLWNNMTREYAEEFLGVEEARGQPLDERNSTLLSNAVSALDSARRSGGIVTRFLGIGLDPLTWKPEILTVAIFEPAVFDNIFNDIIRENEEGRLIFRDGWSTAGIAFTEDNVSHRIRGRMLTAGQACLWLAWKHRRELGIRD